MNKQDDILDFIAGNLDPDRKKEVLAEIKEEPDSLELFRKAKIAWAFMSSAKKMSDYEVEESYEKLHARISSTKTARTLPITYLKYAASIVLIVSISSVMFYLGRQNSGSISETRYTSVVAEKGQISKVILPDSSIVWLNSGTTIKYNSNFGRDNRDIDLVGQAFLDVRKNKNLPLIVSNGDLRVKVLGTRFDVCAYPDEKNIQVVLESGKVELSNTKDKSFMYRLNPGEIADYEQTSGDVKIKKINENNYFDWKDGELVFRDSPLTDVVRQLERKYDIQIIVENPLVYKSAFNARFKTESLKEILDYIQFSCHINYRLIPRTDGQKPKVVLN